MALTKVTFFRPCLDETTGGAAKVYADLLPRLSAAGFAVKIIVPASEVERARRMFGDGVEVCALPVTRKMRRVLEQLRLWHTFVALAFIMVRSDVAFIDARPEIVDITKALRRFGYRKPIVLRLGAVPSHDQNKDVRVDRELPAAFRAADRVIVPSEIARDDLVAHYAVPENKIDVVYNALPVKSGDHQTEELMELPLSRPVFLFVGALSPRKDPETAIRAFGHAVQQGLMPETATLWVVGDGPLRAEMEELVRSIDLPSRVRFWGYREDVDAFHRGADIFLHTSRMDGFSYALVEAVAAARPILCADAPVGAISLLKRFGIGSYFPPGDVEALALLMRVAANGEIPMGDGAGLLDQLSPVRFVEGYARAIKSVATITKPSA